LYSWRIQALIAPNGIPLWISEVLPGSVHDITAARELVLAALAPYLKDLPVLADSGYESAGHGVHTPVKQPKDGYELDPDTRAHNRLLRGVGDQFFGHVEHDAVSWPAEPSGRRSCGETSSTGRLRCAQQTMPIIPECACRPRSPASRHRENLNERRAELGKDPVYLTGFGKPLDRAIPGGQLTLLDGYDESGLCDSGRCFT
jgi:hypothetical protein